VRFVWPSVVIALGVVVPFFGSCETVKAYKRFERKFPERWDPSGEDMLREEPRAWALPIGALIVGPSMALLGFAWLIWTLIPTAGLFVGAVLIAGSVGVVIWVLYGGRSGTSSGSSRM
jgi:hypothetical protein